MEQLPISLEAVLQAQEDLDELFTLNYLRRFARRLLQALAFLAQHTMVHCDIRPRQLMLRQPDDPESLVCK